MPENLNGKDLDVAMFDLTGRKTMDLHTTGRKQLDLQLQNLPDGMYALYLRVEGVQLMRKIVLQK